MIAQDLLRTLFSVWMVIVVIIVSQKFIKILEKAVEGHISNDTLLTILGLKTISVGISLIPAATFMSLLMVLGRLYKDQEMSAIAGAGGGAGTLYRAIYLLAIPLSIVSFVLSLYISPWAENRMQRLMNQDEQSSDIRGIAAGKFSEYSQGNLVFYVENITADNTMKSVFVQDRKKDSLSILSAEQSHFEELPGGRYMVFENGQRIQGHPGDFNYVIEEFKQYAFKVAERAASNYVTPKAVPSSKLWTSIDKKEIAELQNRLSIPITILIFAFVSVPLSKISPRGGIYGSMMLGFLIFFSHGNFSGVTQSWLIKGSIPIWPGIFWVNLSLFFFGLLMLANWFGFKWLFLSFKKRFIK
ncbi:MAG: LPS export ABC transporter permease LptF [Methylococcaceae bacterium]|nr:LPS export ABC transporter permease LptF [Methylococcaceae bacterium]